MEERAGERRIVLKEAPLLNPLPTRSSWGEEEKSSQKTTISSFSGTNEHESQGLAQKLGIICTPTRRNQLIEAQGRPDNRRSNALRPHTRQEPRDETNSKEVLTTDEHRWTRMGGGE
jgi:hypothetical protein